VTHPGTKHSFDNISLTLATTPPCTLSAILRSHHAALLDSLSVVTYGHRAILPCDEKRRFTFPKAFSFKRQK